MIPSTTSIRYKSGQPYLKQYKITDEYKVILRRDFNEFSREELNHWKLELQTTKGNRRLNQDI